MKTREEARKAIADAGITVENVTKDQLSKLRELVDGFMHTSGNYNGTYRMDNHVGLFMTCSTEQWEGREAISFNRDGFIGIAGWADSKNTTPILRGIKAWVQYIRSPT